MAGVRSSDAFARDYADARRRFLEAADRGDAEVESHQHPLRGPGGERLFTDVAWIGPQDARRLLITLSGTHGVEGYAGAGIQTASLREGRYRALPDGTAVMLVHAVTPHGFAWGRRVDEAGVDVCRNFVDFGKPLPPNPFYDRFAHDLVPEEWSGPGREAAEGRLFDYLGEHGVDHFKAVLARGQYSHDFAPFFGGRAPTWSNRTVRAILRERAQRAREVAAIDYHSGLGEYATGQMLDVHPTDDPRHARGRECWGEKCVSLHDDATVAYVVTGDLLQGLEEELPHAQVTSSAYEFGTVEAIAILQALRADHWLHTYGDLGSPQARLIAEEVRDAFVCESDDWREAVFELASVAEREALAMLAES
jgi:hypothetical protein